MKKLTLEIKPVEGFGEINFGESTEKVISILGEAEEVEDIEDDDLFNTVILNYWNQGISVFMEGIEKSSVACFETDNDKATLYGNKVFEMSKEEILSLMGKEGFEIGEEGVEEDGEHRISYDDAMIDFFFENGNLVAVNWGVLINEQGDIEEMPH